jgi:glycine/D-amino acid oxidase-like deaminating enzyme
MKYDVIVLGVGGMGSASVYQLAKRGLRGQNLAQKGGRDGTVSERSLK